MFRDLNPVKPFQILSNPDPYNPVKHQRWNGVFRKNNQELKAAAFFC